jgi:LPXTG-motif cell wall-anchored protein
MVADEVTLDPEVAASMPAPPSTGSKNVFWAALVMAVLVLLALIVRLISKTEVA